MSDDIVGLYWLYPEAVAYRTSSSRTPHNKLAHNSHSRYNMSRAVTFTTVCIVAVALASAARIPVVTGAFVAWATRALQSPKFQPI